MTSHFVPDRKRRSNKLDALSLATQAKVDLVCTVVSRTRAMVTMVDAVVDA